VTGNPTDPVNKKMTVKDFMGNNRSNTKVVGTFTVNGSITVTGNTYTVTTTTVKFTNFTVNNFVVASNGIIIRDKYTPSNSTVSIAGSGGKIHFDNNYLYVKTANNVTKRIALSSF
jgi:hypothetical protein